MICPAHATLCEVVRMLLSGSVGMSCGCWVFVCGGVREREIARLSVGVRVGGVELAGVCVCVCVCVRARTCVY